MFIILATIILNRYFLNLPLEKLLEDAKVKAKQQEDDLELLKKEYNRFKAMLGQTQQARSKRAQNVTTFEMISDFKSST